MRTDLDLKNDLIEKIDAIPALNASDIEVFVDDGMVKLSGEVSTKQLRFQLERTARRIPGLRGLEVNIRSMQSLPKKSHMKKNGIEQRDR